MNVIFWLLTDARTLVDHARIEAQHHRFTFDEVFMVNEFYSLLK